MDGFSRLLDSSLRDEDVHLMELFVLVPLIGTPIALGLSWWRWSHQRLSELGPKWKARALFLGLLAGSGNAAMYYSWLTYRLVAGGTPRVWKLQDSLGNISIYPCFVALVCAGFGEDVCPPLVCCAFLGWALWWRYGIL